MTSEEQVAFFKTNGYLIIEDLISNNEVAQCASEIARLHELAAKLEAKHDPAFKHFQREPFAEGADMDGLPVLRKIEETERFSETFKRLPAHPDLVTVLRTLLGNDLLLFRSTLMLKPAFHGSVHALHQDSAYWPIKPPTMITVSIALTDSTKENGCLQVIPGSHEWGLLEWGQIWQKQTRDVAESVDLDTSNKIGCPLRKGSALLFHSMVVHGSGPNRSSRPRHTALYAYLPSHVRLEVGPHDDQEMTFPVISGFDGKERVTLVSEAASGQTSS